MGDRPIFDTTPIGKATMGGWSGRERDLRMDERPAKGKPGVWSPKVDLLSSSGSNGTSPSISNPKQPRSVSQREYTSPVVRPAYRARGSKGARRSR